MLEWSDSEGDCSASPDGADAVTVLYRIKPRDQDNPYREGLISYIIRLARAHCVGTRDLLRFALSREEGLLANLGYSGFFSTYSGTVNGLGRYATAISSLLNRLTGRDDLQSLTMLFWADVLPANGYGLLCSKPRWCPRCLCEQVNEHGESHAPLAWSLLLYRRCTKHKLDLVDRCPSCGRDQPFLPTYPDASTCDYCRCSLMQLPGEAPLNANCESRADQPSVEQVVLSLIGSASLSQPRPTLELFQSRVREVVERSFGGNRSAFCREMGWQPRAMNGWFLKNQRPSFPMLVEMMLSYDLGLELHSTSTMHPGLFGGQPSNLPRLRLVCRAKVPRLSANWRRNAAAALRQCIQETGEMPTMSAVASSLGVSRHALKYWCQADCQRLVVDGRRRRVLAAERRRSRRAELVIQAIKKLQMDGVFPSRRKVDRELRRHGLALARPEAMAIYRRLVRQR
ncbi:MAG TPA: TniQ family protein [Burkholderiaceae bacterium]|jgi:hypothetical protein